MLEHVPKPSNVWNIDKQDRRKTKIGKNGETLYLTSFKGYPKEFDDYLPAVKKE